MTVDGFDTMVPWFLSLILAMLGLLALGALAASKSDEERVLRRVIGNLLCGVSPFREASAGNRIARAAALLPCEARGLPPDDIRWRLRRSADVSVRLH